MKITNDLIEKYHLNLCSPQEKKAVEQWLEFQTLDDEITHPGVIEADKLEAEIWQSLSKTVYDGEARHKKIFPFGNSSMFNMAIAASLVLLTVVSAGIWWYNNTRWTSTVTLSNMKDSTSGRIEAKGLKIAMAARSEANITTTASQTRSTIDFCGAMSIETRKDVRLTLNSICEDGEKHSEIRTLKKGETYIAVNYHFIATEELLIVNSKDMADLPPALRRQVAGLF